MLRVKVLFVLFLCVGLGLGKAEETIKCSACSENIVQLSSIIIPAESKPVEKYAADELAKYIKKMTGQSLVVVKEGAKRPEGRAIILGCTKENLAEHNPNSWPIDTIYIGYGKGDIAIVGQGNQGTLFAAYEFLRDQGCRWYMPGEIGEYIPKRCQLDLLNNPIRHSPSFIERGWSPTAASPPIQKTYYQPWAVRNGLNAMRLGGHGEYSAEYGYGSVVRAGHTIWTLIPTGDHPDTQKTFDAHPQWYPLVSGKRVTKYKDGRPIQACISNPEVVQEVARKVIDYFRQHPRVWRFSLGHSDEPAYWCECENCLAMDAPDSTWRVNSATDAYPENSSVGPGPMSDRYVSFVNSVAKIVAKEYPGKYINFYAYATTVAPPRKKGWKLEPNVLVEYANATSCCLRHDFDDSKCQPNVEFKSWLDRWNKDRNGVIYYDYPAQSCHRVDVPAGFCWRYKSYLTFMKRMGVISFLGEDEGTWAGSGLAHYVKARLLWDIEADVDKLIHEFCRDMYGGQAAVTMRKFYETFDRKLRELDDHAIYGSWINILGEDVIEELNGFLIKAEQQAKTPDAKKRIDMMQVAMNSLVLTRMQENPDMQRDAEAFEHYCRLRDKTLKMVNKINEPLPIVVSYGWLDLLKGTYRPPIEAINGKELLTLPTIWRFRTDPNDKGIKEGWNKEPNTDTESWQDISTDIAWTEQGIMYHGVAWYATRMTVPPSAQGRLWLLFGALDGDADIWIDGQPAGRLLLNPWDKPKAVNITSLVKAGQEHLIVVRVLKANFAAGINKGVKLMSSSEEKQGLFLQSN